MMLKMPNDMNDKVIATQPRCYEN